MLGHFRPTIDETGVMSCAICNRSRHEGRPPKGERATKGKQEEAQQYGQVGFQQVCTARVRLRVLVATSRALRQFRVKCSFRLLASVSIAAIRALKSSLGKTVL